MSERKRKMRNEFVDQTAHLLKLQRDADISLADAYESGIQALYIVAAKLLGADAKYIEHDAWYLSQEQKPAA